MISVYAQYNCHLGPPGTPGHPYCEQWPACRTRDGRYTPGWLDACEHPACKPPPCTGTGNHTHTRPDGVVQLGRITSREITTGDQT